MDLSATVLTVSRSRQTDTVGSNTVKTVHVLGACHLPQVKAWENEKSTPKIAAFAIIVSREDNGPGVCAKEEGFLRFR